MRIAGLIAALLCLALAAPCFGQMMDASQYRDHLKRTDEVARRWEKQLNSIDIDKLKVSYPTGQTIEKARNAIVENFGLMHGFIAQQLALETLSGDILIENVLSDVSSPLDTLIDFLPSTEEGVYWTRTLAPMSGEIADLQIPLRKHINTLADKTQLKAERCSR